MRLVFSISVGLILCATTASREVGCDWPVRSCNVAASTSETGPATFSAFDTLSAFATQTKKLSNAEIEKLVDELGNSKTRESASKKLQACSQSIHYLRRHLNGRGAELRREMERVIKVMAAVEFKRRLDKLVDEKGKAPIDLLAELMVENQDHVDNDAWKKATAIVGAVAAKVASHHRIDLTVPDPAMEKPRRYEKTEALLVEDLYETHIITKQLKLAKHGIMSDCAVFSRQMTGHDTCHRSFMLVTGGRTNAPPPIQIVCLGRSFLYCDCDFHAKITTHCMVVSRGQIRVHDAISKKSILLSEARDSPKICLFSGERIGLELKWEKQQIVVFKVLPGVADRSGVKQGDVILTEPNEDLSALECRMRIAFAKQGDLSLSVRRGNQTLILVLPLIDE